MTEEDYFSANKNIEHYFGFVLWTPIYLLSIKWGMHFIMIQVLSDIFTWVQYNDLWI